MKIPLLDKFLKGRKVPEKIFEREPIGAKDIVAPASIEVTQANIKLGERLAKSFFIFSYPRYLSTAWLSPVVNLDTPMDVSMFIHPIESKEVLKKLRKRVAEVQAEIIEKEEKGEVRDPQLETAYRDLENLRDKLQTAREKMFHFSLYITIYGDNEKELEDVETTLRSILESRLIYPKPALFQQKECFISSIPYGSDKLGVSTAMNTAPLSSVFPFISFDLSSNEGILYGINQHNQSLVLFDRFSLENANSVIFGKAGSGKSLTKQQPVLAVKDNSKVVKTEIGKLIDDLIEKEGAEKIDRETEGVINPDLKVFTFDKNLKGKWAKVNVAARKKAPKTFYKFKTQSGREITTTGDHNMVILKNGKVGIAKSSEVKEGEFVPLPRKVSVSKKPLRSLNLLRLLKKSKGIYIKEAEDLVLKNYKKLKAAGISNRSNKYLYFYRKGTVIPIKLFWKMLKCLGIEPDSQELNQIRITHAQRGKGFKSRLSINNDLLKIAGFITAEGSTTKAAIAISNFEKKVYELISSLLKNLGVSFHRIKNKKKGRVEGIKTNDRVFIEIVKALEGTGRSGEKRVWPFVFSLSQEQIAQYLSAYFEGDGGIEENKVVASSKSKKLITEITYLLYYFGIIGRITKTKKKPTNCNWEKKKPYWKLTISGQKDLKRFAKKINFISEKKKKALSEITKKDGNTNVDIIPEIDSTFKEIQDLFAPLLYNIPEAHEWKLRKRRPSPHHLRKVINKIRNRIKDFKELEPQFKILSELPELNTIIELGKNDKELNSELWKELGESWRLMKHKEISPKSRNAFRAIKVVNGNSYSLKELKNKIHFGFKEMNLCVKHYNKSLQHALVARPKSNTRYEMIQEAAHYVWENYQEVLNDKIPQIEKKLDQLETLANSDLFWDPIVEIKKVKNKEEYVYDLEVDNEVFLAGKGGLFIHNSYFQKLEILRSLMTGVSVLVVDPENEYEFLSDAVGGSYFKMSLTSPHHINPFDLPPPREDESPEDVLRSNIINLVGLLRIMLGGLSPEEDAIIDRALTETYRARDITPETDPSLWPERIPLMEDLESVLETMEGAESLLRRLRKFTTGSYAGFFNQPSNVSMDNNFVAFGIRDMEEELRPMAMFIIMRHIWNTIRAQLKKRILVIDEAWWLMTSEDGASFLYGTAKRARKYWLGVTTITQDVIDFMKSTYGKPIITNSSIQLLMKQSPAGVDLVKKTFSLTDAEKRLLLECPVGEGLFFAGPKHVAIRVVASYTEDQVITTAPEEVLKIKRAKEQLKGAPKQGRSSLGNKGL